MSLMANDPREEISSLTDPSLTFSISFLCRSRFRQLEYENRNENDFFSLCLGMETKSLAAIRLKVQSELERELEKAEVQIVA